MNTPLRAGLGIIVIWLCLLLGTGTLHLPAANLEIQSIDTSGQLVFNALNDGTNYNYRLDWAPTPCGPWTNFIAAPQDLDNIVTNGSGVVTCSVPIAIYPVPMCCRLVATATNTGLLSEENLYLVVDLSGGTNATTYPVSYLSAVPGGGWTDEYKTTKLVLRRIPAGTFTMGSPTNELGRYYDETQHVVTLTQPFYIGVFEVTQKQWERVMGNWPSYFNNASYRDTRPVEQVSYYKIRENPNNSAISPNWPQSSQVHADSFMGKLRSKTGLTTLDLPTESQWEYACRAGTTTALNSGYNLTSTSTCPNMAEVGRYWYNGGSGFSQGCAPNAGTATVGSYLPNAWGLYDMHGNVKEWCLDWYGTYPGTVTDPSGAASGSNRVERGMGWFEYAGHCRSAMRGRLDPSRRDISGGFRLSRTLP